MVWTKVATIWVELGDMTETALLVLNPLLLSFGTFWGSLLFKVLVIFGEG